MGLGFWGFRVLGHSRSPKAGNPIASVLKSNVKGIPALFGLNPVSNFMEFTVSRFRVQGLGFLNRVAGTLWLMTLKP